MGRHQQLERLGNASRVIEKGGAQLDRSIQSGAKALVQNLWRGFGLVAEQEGHHGAFRVANGIDIAAIIVAPALLPGFEIGVDCGNCGLGSRGNSGSRRGRAPSIVAKAKRDGERPEGVAGELGGVVGRHQIALDYSHRVDEELAELPAAVWNDEAVVARRIGLWHEKCLTPLPRPALLILDAHAAPHARGIDVVLGHSGRTAGSLGFEAVLAQKTIFEPSDLAEVKVVRPGVEHRLIRDELLFVANGQAIIWIRDVELRHQAPPVLCSLLGAAVDQLRSARFGVRWHARTAPVAGILVQ
mmetsp:Transcript_9856/g.31499  ORF Transcript_9856/g.31499 Transcript_9856/m.31499 type:complete len:300 (-) Transcript_9856:505-1404(-)